MSKVFFIANNDDVNDNSMAWVMSGDWDMRPIFFDAETPRTIIESRFNVKDVDGDAVGFYVASQELRDTDPMLFKAWARLGIRDDFVAELSNVAMQGFWSRGKALDHRRTILVGRGFFSVGVPVSSVATQVVYDAHLIMVELADDFWVTCKDRLSNDSRLRTYTFAEACAEAQKHRDMR